MLASFLQRKGVFMPNSFYFPLESNWLVCNLLTPLLCVEVDGVRGDYTPRQMTNISWACLDKNADDLMFALFISLHSLVLIPFVLGEAGGC